MKVFYHIDNDGRCAAFWVRALAKHFDEYEMEFIKINYGIEFPFDSIRENEQIYIVDYSILPEEMDKLLNITTNVTWIDHHISAIERYKNYNKEIRGIRYDGVAGCMLTYCYLNHMTKGGIGDITPFHSIMKNDAPMFTKYIADYDIWAFEYGDNTRAFARGTNIYDLEPQSGIWDLLNLENSLTKTIIKAGETIIKYRQSMMTEYCKSKGFEANLLGYKCFCVNMAAMNSDDFIIPNIEDYDMLIGFSFDGKVWSYSLRSDKIDCSQVAMKFGGGGHKGAAGFNNTELILHKVNEV